LVVATALGWGNAASIALAVVLAFCFGYALTLRPLLGARTRLRDAARIALAADTLSITVVIARGRGHAVAHRHHALHRDG
jgi:hypothetical protein